MRFDLHLKFIPFDAYTRARVAHFSNISPLRNRLFTKIVLYVFVFATLVSVLIIGLQLYQTYKKEKLNVVETLENLAKSQKETLLHSIWNFDQVAIDIQLNSLCDYPDVSFITFNNGIDEVFTYCNRTYDPGRLIKKSFH